MRTYGIPEPASRSCGNVPSPDCRDFSVAMAYVPWQRFSQTYDPDKALEVGTIFPELDKPFLGGRGRKR